MTDNTGHLVHVVLDASAPAPHLPLTSFCGFARRPAPCHAAYSSFTLHAYCLQGKPICCWQDLCRNNAQSLRQAHTSACVCIRDTYRSPLLRLSTLISASGPPRRLPILESTSKSVSPQPASLTCLSASYDCLHSQHMGMNNNNDIRPCEITKLHGSP